MGMQRYLPLTERAPNCKSLLQIMPLLARFDDR